VLLSAATQGTLDSAQGESDGLADDALREIYET
jgi:hypothetical protein